MLPRIEFEGGDWVRRHKRALVYSLLSLSVLAAGSCALNRGVDLTGPSGEGKYFDIGMRDESLVLRYAVRSEGRRPVPCGEERPLTGTIFTQRDYMSIWSLVKRPQEKIEVYQVEAPKGKECVKIPW